MSIFKRLSATLVSRIDKVVGEIENHDAVIQASLDDMRKKIAAAKIRLAQVRREEARLKQQITEQQQNEQRWRQRAVETAASDEDRALECLRRSHHCQQQVQRLSQAVLEYQQTSDKLVCDIQSSEQRLSEIKQKQTLLRARQSSSAALIATNADDTTTRLLDDTFERWEINVSQAEMILETDAPFDAIEDEFISREQQLELRQELATLLAEELDK